MATLPPNELLSLWKLEQMPIEMSIGHVLQNLVKLHSDLDAHHSALYHLRADVDRLIADAGIGAIDKGKKKPIRSS